MLQRDLYEKHKVVSMFIQRYVYWTKYFILADAFFFVFIFQYLFPDAGLTKEEAIEVQERLDAEQRSLEQENIRNKVLKVFS